MNILNGFIVLLWVTLVSSNISTEGDCGILDGDTKATLDNVFNNLPSEFVDESTEGSAVIAPTLALGKTSLTGLDRMYVDRPYQVFCREGDKMVLLSLSSPSLLRFLVPWEFCNAYNGTIGVTAGVVRYEAEVQLQNDPSSKPKLRLNRLIPTVLERVQLEMRHSGPLMETAAAVLGQVFAGSVRLFWTDGASSQVGDAIKDALSKTN